MIKKVKRRVQTEEYDYAVLAPKVKAALRRTFSENSTIVASPDYQGRIDAKIVFEQLNGMTERDKQAYIWDALNDELKENAQAVSLAYGTDEL